MMRGSRPCQVKLESCPLGGEKQPELEMLAARHPEPKKPANIQYLFAFQKTKVQVFKTVNNVFLVSFLLG